MDAQNSKIYIDLENAGAAQTAPRDGRKRSNQQVIPPSLDIEKVYHYNKIYYETHKEELNQKRRQKAMENREKVQQAKLARLDGIKKKIYQNFLELSEDNRLLLFHEVVDKYPLYMQTLCHKYFKEELEDRLDIMNERAELMNELSSEIKL